MKAENLRERYITTFSLVTAKYVLRNSKRYNSMKKIYIYVCYLFKYAKI